MCLDLKHEKGRDIFLQLVKRVDVVVENFRPGAMERLGFDYESLDTGPQAPTHTEQDTT